MQKRLLIFQPIIAPYRIDFINEIAKHFEVKVCLTRTNLGGQHFDLDKLYKERLSINPVFLRSSEKSRDWMLIPQVSEIIESFKPDAVLVPEFGIITCSVIWHKLIHASQMKIIGVVDESYDMVTNNQYFSYRHKVAQRILMPLIDQVINVNPRVTAWYREHYKKGVYFPIISDDVRYRERLRQALSISEDYIQTYHLQGKKVLLFVGRLSAEKNIATAVKAFQNAKISDTAFIIVGDGPERENLLSLVRDDKTIILPGRFEGDTLYAWYNVAHVFILPSVKETFGAVTNEALLAGCYALVSKQAGSSCLVIDGINGNTFDAQHENELSALMKHILSGNKPMPKGVIVKPNLMQQSFMSYFDHLMTCLEQTLK